MRRGYLLHIILFLCAYAGFVAYYQPGIRKTAINSTPVKRQEDRSSAASPVVALPVSIATHTATIPVPKPAAVTAIDDGVSPDVHVEIETLGIEATQSALPVKRRSAIIKLSMRPLTPETTQALQAALTADPVAANRVQAVHALRRLAQQNGDDDGRIRSLLNSALQDAEPEVVRVAKELVDSLSGSQT